MDWRDPLKDTMRHLQDVPVNLNGKKSKTKNSKKNASTFKTEASQEEENKAALSSEKILKMKLKLAKRTDTMGTAKARKFATFEDLFDGDLPCTLLYLDRNSSRLKSFKTFNELSEFIETADENLTGMSEGKNIEMLQSASVGQLAHFTTLGKYLRYLYKEDRLMDVHIDVHGTSFMAHRIVLCCHSGYFKNLLINDRKSVKIPIQVKVFGVSVEAFAAFIQYIYTGKINIHRRIISDFIYIAEYLDVKSLRHKLFSIADNLPLDEAIKFLLKPCDPCGELYCTALSKIINQFSAASMIPAFLDLNVEIFCSILKSDALQVAREYEVFQVAVRWLVHGGKDRIPFITQVMNSIRFCHMTVEELFDCLEETSLFLDHKDLRDLILIANWVLTAMRLNKADPFNIIVPPYRTNYRHHQKDKNRRKNNPPHFHMKGKEKLSIQNSFVSTSSSSHSSNQSTKQSIFKSSNEVCTDVEKSRSPRQGKTLIVPAKVICETGTKWQETHVYAPPEYLENSAKQSQTYGTPAILPKDINYPIQSYTTEPETKNVATSTSSSAERFQVTNWTQTSSTKSSPNRSPALEQNTLLPQDKMPSTIPRTMISPEAEENISNHSSPRYAKPLMLPPKDDMSKAHSTTEQSIVKEDIVQRPSISPASHSTPTNWSHLSSSKPLSMLPPKDDMQEEQSTAEPSEIQKIVVQPKMSPCFQSKPTNWNPFSSIEPLENREAQARPMVLPPEESQNLNFPHIQNIIDKLELLPHSHERNETQLKSLNEKPEINSAKYIKPVLLPSMDIQKPKSIYRPKMSPASHVKPTNWSPDPIKESTTNHKYIPRDKTPSVTQPVKYAKPILLPPNFSPVKTNQMPTKKCECRPTISPAGHSQPTDWWPNPKEFQRIEKEAILTEVQQDISVKETIMPAAGHEKQKIWPPNSNQCSNPQTCDSDSSFELSADSRCTSSSSTGDDEFVDAYDTQNQSSETHLWFEARDVIENISKDVGDTSLPNEKQEVTQSYLPASGDRIVKASAPTEKKDSLPAMSKVLPTKDIIGVGCFDEKISSAEEGGQDLSVAFCNLPNVRSAFAVASVGRNVYVIGGLRHDDNSAVQKVTNTVFRMDFLGKDWVQVASMTEARMSHCACVLDGIIYVFGGLDEHGSPLASCEYYKPETDEWTTMWLMPYPLYAGSAAALGRKCYVAGGMTHNASDQIPRLRMTMICYDTEIKRWSVPAYLRMPQCHASLVNVQGRLLLCGGATYKDEKARRRDLVSVATIDEYNVLTSSWRFRTKMSSARQEVSAVVIGSKLYIIGGKTCADADIVPSVECYDMHTSAWTKCGLKLPSSTKYLKCLSCQNMK